MLPFPVIELVPGFAVKLARGGLQFNVYGYWEARQAQPQLIRKCGSTPQSGSSLIIETYLAVL